MTRQPVLTTFWALRTQQATLPIFDESVAWVMVTSKNLRHAGDDR